MKSFHQQILSLGLLFAVSGCAWLNGIGAGTTFACKAPDGVTCNSITGVAANADAGNLPALQIKHQTTPTTVATVADKKPDNRLLLPNTAIATGTPVRVAPHTLRVWIAPYVDRDGDLSDQAYVYMNVDSGRWLLEHTSNTITDQYRAVTAVQKDALQNPLDRTDKPIGAVEKPPLLPQILEQGKR